MTLILYIYTYIILIKYLILISYYLYSQKEIIHIFIYLNYKENIQTQTQHINYWL